VHAGAAFHGTALANFDSIRDEGFRFVGLARSASFAKEFAENSLQGYSEGTQTMHTTYGSQA
jgi:hypothetical protein